GTNAGHVFSGYFGPQFRKTYSVKGDAVNTAARVMAKAEPGQILATASVLDAATALHELDAIEPFAAKGKRNLVHAWGVGRRVGTKGEVEQLRFVGRANELAGIDEALSRARSGAGGVVEIVGPAGIGKTRFLGEVLHRAHGFRILRALSEPYQQRIAYRSARVILRQALDLPKEAGSDRTIEKLQGAVAEVAAH